MAPVRAKKPRVSIGSDISTRNLVVTTKSPARTPIRSPQKRIVGVTEAQKQALIDNLQLEVTERARKLRAQYALQAQSLRTRIEMRVNRIPAALKKANMGELYAKYTEMQIEKQQIKAQEPQTMAARSDREAVKSAPIQEQKSEDLVAAPNARGTKRNSDIMDNTDKENVDDRGQDQPIPNPKKRNKAANSRQAPIPSTVLSPKSANSRTLPQSPIRPTLGSPQKSYAAHTVSPLKPPSLLKVASPAKVAAAAATATLASMVQQKPKPGRPKAATGRKATNPLTIKATGTRTKRGAVAEIHEPEDVRKASNTSNISNVSAASNVVKHTKKGSAVAEKKGDVGVRAVGKRVTAVKEAPITGRRVLRKRA